MSKRILVVEDQEDNLRIMRDLLTDAGFEVIEAVNGNEALSVAEAERPHGYTASGTRRVGSDTTDQGQSDDPSHSGDRRDLLRDERRQ